MATRVGVGMEGESDIVERVSDIVDGVSDIACEWWEYSCPIE